MMTREEAIARIKDHMSVHKIYEERAVIITEALNMAISALKQPEIVRCKDCKYRMPYDWMFSETWRSQNIYDYSEDEIGCQYCDMTMKADDFCSRAERREEGGE